MKTYNAINAFITNSIWLLTQDALDAIRGVVRAREAGLQIDAETAEKMAATNKKNRTAKVSRSVAVLPIVGVLSQRMDLMAAMSGGTSTERLGREFDALVSDGSVDAIVLDIDSPGGNYYGTPELASKIMAARGSKPIVAVANSMAASAAYWIGTAADELVVTPSGDVGSVGVVAVHGDESGANEQMGVSYDYVTYGRHKAEANPDGPLSTEAREHIQQQVDVAGKTFDAAVAAQRGTTAKVVHDTFGQGRTFDAKTAIGKGMADRIGTLEGEIDRLANAQRVRRGRKAAVRRQRLDLLQ